MTLIRQGWMLLPLALRLATVRSSSTVDRAIGVGKNARTDLRLLMASSTAVFEGLEVSCIVKTQGFHAFRNFAQKQPLDVVIRQQVRRIAFAGDLSEMHHIAAIGDTEGMGSLLFDHHDGHSFSPQRQQLLEYNI